MPTDSPQKSSDDILQDIVEGNYTKFTSLADFKTILNQILIDIECEDSQNKQNFLKFECDSPEVKNLVTHFFLQSTLGKGLNSIFDLNAEFIILNKDNLSDDIIKKLILLGTHYNTMYEVKINEVNSSFNENDIITTSSFLNFVTSLFNIPNITEFETHGLNHQKIEGSLPNITFGDLQKIDTLVRDTIKLSEDLTHRLNFNRYSYEKVSAQNFLESLGRLGFELKLKEEFQDDTHRIPAIVQNILSSTNSTSFSKEDRGEAAYTFLSGFNDKNEKQIKADCVDLLGLEDCPRPATASTRLFQQIADGDYINPKPSFANFVQVESEIKVNIHTLNRDQSTHILTFLKNVLKTNNGSSNTFNFKNLYGFAFNSIDNLTRDLQQRNRLDDSFSQAAESLSFFLFNIVKNNVNDQDLLDQIHIVTQYSKLYENIIVHAPHLKSLLDTMGKHLFSILARNIDSESALQRGYRDFINIIKDVNQVCRANRQACNLAEIFTRSMERLGSMHRKSSGYALNATREAKALIESTRGNINPEQLSDAVSFFFKANISQTVLNRKCKEIFNLTGCRPASLISPDSLAYGEIDEITTTLLPEDLIDTNVTTPASQIIANATVAPAINQTTPAVIVDPNPVTELSYSNVTLSNQTDTRKIENIENNPASSATHNPVTVIAAAGYGGISGIFNASARHFYPNHPMFVIAVNTVLATAAPLVLFAVEEHFGSDTQDQTKLTWMDMAWQMPTNFTAASLTNTALHYATDVTNNLSSFLSNYPILQSATKHSVPFATTVASIVAKPVETAVHIGTSIVSSFSASRVFNFFWPRKKINSSDVEAHSQEMQKLNGEKVVETSTTDTITETKILEKTYQYICLPELNEIKKLSQSTLNQLKKLIDTFENDIQAQEAQIKNIKTPGILKALEKSIKDNSYILEKIKIQFNSAEIFHTELTLDMHLQACEMYTNEQKKQFVQAMEKLGNVFKLMKTNFETLQGELKSAIGYTNAASDSFSNQVTLQLTELIQTIIFPLHKVTLYKDRYSNADAVEKTEQRCKTEANHGFFNVIAAASSHQNTSTTIRRDNKGKNNDTNSRNTIAFYRGSEGDLRISTASSSGESEFSTTSGNSAHNPIDQQQKAPLLENGLKV